MCEKALVTDYLGKLVPKKWGFEFVCFDNGAAAITILHIARGRKTSLHMHERKRTTLIVLRGTILFRMGPGAAYSPRLITSLDTVVVPPMTFHQSEAIGEGNYPTAEDGCWLMEIEEPSDKEDLVRAEDEYGREGKPYETDVVRYTGKLLQLSETPQDFLGYRFRIGTPLVASKNDGIIVPVGDGVLTIEKTNTMRLADYVANFIADFGITHVFSVSGGGSMTLVDAFGNHPKIKYVACHHEQAAAMAAEAYARMNGIGCCLVTSGPGGTNALTGVACAWVDSIPVIFISGQVTTNTMMEGMGVRQFGVQETDIETLVTPVTKYARTLRDANLIRTMLEWAAHEARSERPGPVWLDIPLELQGIDVDASTLGASIDWRRPTRWHLGAFPAILQQNVREALDLLRDATRPVLIVGNGIRLAGAEKEILALVDALGIPVVTSWTGSDLIGDHPNHIGHAGIFGDRASNFAVQNADLLLIIGSRMSIPQTGYNFAAFAREAKIIMVDVDEHEMKKPSLRVTLPIVADAKDFIKALVSEIERKPLPYFDPPQWGLRCEEWREKYPVVLPEYAKSEKVHSAYFVDQLSKLLPPDAVVCLDMGTSFTGVYQCAKMKYGQRWITASGHAPMGYGLPGAIGAAFASGKKVFAIVGDGGLQFNVQELATIAHHDLPITIFVLNNAGYLAIKHTQSNHFGAMVGCDKRDLSFPDFQKLADAYRIPCDRIETTKELDQRLGCIVKVRGPLLVEIMMPELQALYPRVSSKKRPDGAIVSHPLEAMFPFLPEDEFRAQMIVPPIEILK